MLSFGLVSRASCVHAPAGAGTFWAVECMRIFFACTQRLLLGAEQKPHCMPEPVIHSWCCAIQERIVPTLISAAIQGVNYMIALMHHLNPQL